MKVNLAVIQLSYKNNHQDNMANMINQIRGAKTLGANLVLLPELHNSHYFCQTADPENLNLAETIPGPSTKVFSELAKELEIVLVTSLYEKAGNGVYYNTSVVFETDGEIAGIYRKMHIPDDPGYYEKYYFTPSNLGFNPIQTSLGKLGILICWDQWFPEAARCMALAGADILLYPTAIGFAPEDTEEEKLKQLDAWMTVQRSHAVANSLPVAACNRTGFEADPSNQTQGIDFWGSSFITGHQGEFLEIASTGAETILITEIDLQNRDSVQRVWPYFRDRRVDAYDRIGNR